MVYFYTLDQYAQDLCLYNQLVALFHYVFNTLKLLKTITLVKNQFLKMLKIGFNQSDCF